MLSAVLPFYFALCTQHFDIDGTCSIRSLRALLRATEERKALRFSVPVWIALAWTGILALALALGMPFGIPGEWVWAFRDDLHFPLPTLLLTIFCLTGLAGIVWQATKSFHRGWVIGGLLMAIGLRFCFAALQPQKWLSASVFWVLVIASPIATSFFNEAEEVERQGIGDYLRHYHETLATKPFHASTHPPGLPLIFAALRWLTRPPLLQRLVPMDEATVQELQRVYGKLLPFPLSRYDARPLTAWEFRAAWWAAVFCLLCSVAAFLLWAWLLSKPHALCPMPLASIALAATTPASLWWLPTVDTIHFLVIIGVLVCALQWRHTSGWGWAMLTGLFGGVALWLAFKNAVPLACIALWLVWEHGAKGKGQRAKGKEQRAKDPMPYAPCPMLHAPAVLGQWLLMVALCVAPYGLAWLLFGFQPLATLEVASAAHHAQAGAHARSYLPWVVMNLLDFVMGMGGAWLGLTIVYLWHWWRHQRWQPSLTVVTLTVLLALNFSGMVRGETARLWLPFVPLLTLFQSHLFQSHCGKIGASAVLLRNGQPQPAVLLVAVQGILALALHLRLEFLRPW